MCSFKSLGRGASCQYARETLAVIALVLSLARMIEAGLDCGDPVGQFGGIDGLEQDHDQGRFRQSQGAGIDDALVWGAGFVINTRLLAVHGRMLLRDHPTCAHR